MPFKRQHAQHNATQVASVEVFKKKRLEASPLFNLEQLNTNDNKLSTINSSNDESARCWYIVSQVCNIRSMTRKHDIGFSNVITE